MSQVTRCPACATSFKVVPDQLRISQGWVRCGQCHEVFDALVDLRDPGMSRADGAMQEPGQAPAAPAEERATVSSEGGVPAPLIDPQASDDLSADIPPGEPVLPAGTAPLASVLEVAPQWLQSAPSELPVTDPAASLDVGFAEYQQAQVQAEEPAPTSFGLGQLRAESVATVDVPQAACSPGAQPTPETPQRLFVAIAADAIARAEGAAPIDTMPLPQRPTVPESDPAGSAPMPLRTQTVDRPDPGRAAPAVGLAHPDVSFLREATQAAPEHARVAPPRRALWRLWAVVLMLALLGQVAVHSRDRIAAAAPALQPWLQTLCAPLQCSVQPLRRIDAVVIDGSAFMALGDLGYRLSLTLRNRAAHAVALPALVLSLTDIQEQAVVRRVLLPDELGTPPSALPAHGEWSINVDLQMADNAGRARVVGYRLDPFYP